MPAPQSLLVLAVAVLAIAPARANAQNDPRAIIDKTLAAVGGAKKVAKFPAATWKGSGTLRAGAAMPYMIVGARHGADKVAVNVRLENKGMLYSRDLVVAGNKGWLKLNGRLHALSKEELAEEQERMYANWVATLAPLINAKNLTLAAAPPAKVAGKEVVGVKVTSKGRRDVLLYFDRKTGLLAMKRTDIVDVVAGNKKIKEEVFFDGYAPTPAGTKHATKVKVLWDGRLISEVELREITPKAKLADAVFAAP